MNGKPFKPASGIILKDRRVTGLKGDKKVHDAYAAAKKEENARFFDKWSAGYDNFIFAWWMHHLQKKAVAELPPSSKGNLLEVGFGTGRLISSLSQKFRGRIKFFFHWSLTSGVLF